MLRDGEIGSIIVAVEIHKGDWKSKVVHGNNDNEYSYGKSKQEAIESLKKKIVDGSTFKQQRFIVLDTL